MAKKEKPHIAAHFSFLFTPIERANKTTALTKRPIPANKENTKLKILNIFKFLERFSIENIFIIIY